MAGVTEPEGDYAWPGVVDETTTDIARTGPPRSQVLEKQQDIEAYGAPGDLIPKLRKDTAHNPTIYGEPWVGGGGPGRPSMGSPTSLQYFSGLEQTLAITPPLSEYSKADITPFGEGRTSPLLRDEETFSSEIFQDTFQNGDPGIPGDIYLPVPQSCTDYLEGYPMAHS